MTTSEKYVTAAYLVLLGALLVYLLTYYCVLLSVGLVAESAGWHTTAIVAGNLSVNFVVPLLLSLPSVSAHRTGEVAVWTPDILAIIAIELALGVIALVVAVYLRSRASDFV